MKVVNAISIPALQSSIRWLLDLHQGTIFLQPVAFFLGGEQFAYQEPVYLVNEKNISSNLEMAADWHSVIMPGNWGGAGVPA